MCEGPEAGACLRHLGSSNPRARAPGMEVVSGHEVPGMGTRSHCKDAVFTWSFFTGRHCLTLPTALSNLSCIISHCRVFWILLSGIFGNCKSQRRLGLF